jgi:CheY-specific phosphatase CheX
MKSPAVLTADRTALDRALTVVAEESFFSTVEQADGAVDIDGPLLSACVAFSGDFSGTLSCRMSRALALELTAAFTGEEATDGPQVDDMAGEFTNMLCGRWLTDIAPDSLFQLEHPDVHPTPASDVGGVLPAGRLNGQPVWIELAVTPGKA